MISVTKTFLPPKEEYFKIIRQIWGSNQIANGGELLFDLQRKLKDKLGTSDPILTANGTIPLQIALKNLARNGEVITTPFSYVASTSSIVWENCSPVFVDIHPDLLTIDETKIETAITEKTTAILATHVFGNPCHVEEIEKIAKRNNLKVIYDAAHCFGVNYKGNSLFNYGDVSTCSFHATKIFHTGEGGAMFCKDEELYKKLFYSHNFGHKGELEFYGLGINGKMSELQAGMGLAVLPYVKGLIQTRKQQVKLYDETLNFKNLRRIVIREDTDWNYSYYPIIFKSEDKLLKVQKALNDKKIFPRRYFYPSLNTLDYIEFKEMKISQDISERILCLPLYAELQDQEIDLISKIINKVLSTS
ncbi:DegT/DnrJ/EryC1/StrS family aminotransferase [Salegentibacter sp. JZCK2]|uniref:DegT/DnrJ/EryC1/StrS family aminotransferase n=1 Tax=Salegentibacter tibetensis TaxID=2873600 RepID=UPI001CC99DAB|nr:DegT/DnrJ/EryC1/StrS family aminotransferase [Salegentibacter tibetensis]MBZ9729094.1 DegT/DnrJ/EryC1/StrS family aminotransferase [Salegentibacter tibetensis]